jgi:hypothetical protein
MNHLQENNGGLDLGEMVSQELPRIQIEMQAVGT